jgi:hypothetical protein
LWLVAGRDIAAMSCKSFEDRFEDGAAENDHVLMIGTVSEIWCGLLFGSEGFGWAGVFG